MGASSRIRSYQYIPYLKSCGIDIVVAPLLDDEYLQNLYSGKRQSVLKVMDSYCRRIKLLCNVGLFNLVWVEKEVLPWVPTPVEELFVKRKVPFLVDYDDAVFHRYDHHNISIVKRLLGTKIDETMSKANLVTVGNEYLAERARRAGARCVEIIPTVVDLSRYSNRDEPIEKKFTIGWIGSPSTRKYLETVRPALAELCRAGKTQLVLVGSGEMNWPEVPIVLRPWAEETEVNEIMRFDVGIMPLTDAPWERGKCGYKLIQYMACGKPVVGSPVGINNEIISQGINGFRAANIAEWIAVLDRMRDNREEAKVMGQYGRELVEHKYSLQVTAPRLAGLIYNLVNE
jgi:glycosyltransferase involved in cell wall biosynthesis